MEMNITYANKLINSLTLIAESQINWCVAPIQEAMIFEALRKEPDGAKIRLLNSLLDNARELGDIATLESVAGNTYALRQLPKDDDSWREQAIAECLRRQKLGFDKPLSTDPAKAKVEKETRIALQVASLKAKAAEARQRFDDAVELVYAIVSEPDTMAERDQEVSDESATQIDENTIGALYSRLYNELEKQYKLIDSLQGGKLNPWKEQKLQGLLKTSEALAKTLHTSAERVRKGYEKDMAFAEEQWLDGSDTNGNVIETPTIDSELPTPKEKARQLRKAPPKTV